jgi:hypothetical protein
MRLLEKLEKSEIIIEEPWIDERTGNEERIKAIS